MMRLYNRVLLSAIAVQMATAQSDTARPRFEDYPVEQISQAPPVNVDFSHDKRARLYRTVLRLGARSGPNFAGHFTVVTWGCGSSCQQFAIVDALTGKVHFSQVLPYVSWSASDDPFGLQFRLNSRLLIVHGYRKEDPPRGTFYFLWDGASLNPLKAVPSEQ